ncbi:hypothetical protein D3C76_1309230 [compost metagenome]
MNIGAEQLDVVSSHFEVGVAEEVLQSKNVPAIHQKQFRHRVSKHMAGSFHASNACSIKILLHHFNEGISRHGHIEYCNPDVVEGLISPFHNISFEDLRTCGLKWHQSEFTAFPHWNVYRIFLEIHI